MKFSEFTKRREKRKIFFYLLQVILLFFCYYITADFGLRVDAVGGFASLFWLPTGISLAAVLIYGYGMFPAIFLGAFFANYVHGAPLSIAASIAIGNSLEALAGAYLLRRFVNFHLALERVTDVIGLTVFAAFLSTLISSTIGVLSLQVGGGLSVPFLTTWTAWWVGDMVSNLIIAPFLLVWMRRPRLKFSLRQVLETLILTITIVIVGLFVFRGLFGVEITTSPLTYIVFPPLIWAALRFGQREAVTMTLILSLIAVWGTSLGHGPFARESVSESLLFLQSFMIVVATTVMLLAAAVAERRALEKRKDDFISFASHELKTPVTSIKVYTQILNKVFTQKSDQKALKIIQNLDIQINKLVSLINNMLDLTRMQRSTLELDKVEFSLKELIDEIVETMLASSRHEIVRQGTKDVVVYGDRDRISQVITNLLSNAMKYSPETKKIVVITKASRQAVIVRVKDYGMGIPSEHQMKIFDRFYRVSDGNNNTVPGLGIGLYLSKMIIKRHGGDMGVDSTVGKGSTFSFSLPRSTVLSDR